MLDDLADHRIFPEIWATALIDMVYANRSASLPVHEMRNLNLNYFHASSYL